MDFQYIATNVAGAGSDMYDLESVYDGCSCCGGCCSKGSCECLKFGDNYVGERLNNLNPSYIILECGSNCACSATKELCPNRVVQKGIQIPLEVFQTSDKGFGLRTKTDLKCGQFACEYAGEIIGLEESRRRYRSIPAGGPNYIFVLREFFTGIESPSSVTCIDPSRKGNLGRFINHSCCPNLCMVPVRYDLQVPHFGLFACRDVADGEELSYSYGQALIETDTGRETSVKLKTCHCGSEACIGFLPYDALL